MTRLVEVPAHFDDRSFDQFAGAFAEARRDDERLLFDAHAAEWASPYGLVGLLAAGQAARRPGSGAPAERPLLTLGRDGSRYLRLVHGPESADEVRVSPKLRMHHVEVNGWISSTVTPSGSVA